MGEWSRCLADWIGYNRLHNTVGFLLSSPFSPVKPQLLF
jgi:hypothetical protein